MGKILLYKEVLKVLKLSLYCHLGTPQRVELLNCLVLFLYVYELKPRYPNGNKTARTFLDVPFRQKCISDVTVLLDTFCADCTCTAWYILFWLYLYCLIPFCLIKYLNQSINQKTPTPPAVWKKSKTSLKTPAIPEIPCSYYSLPKNGTGASNHHHLS